MTGTTKSNAKTKTAARKTAARPKKSSAKPVATTHKLIWRDITCRVRHTPDYITKDWSHIEIMVLKPKGAPLPITETGYRSHFLGHDELQRAEGPVRFFLDWIEREAASKQWSRAEFKWRQGDLFA